MIGDSTMANKKTADFPETGWGQAFANLLDHNVEINNYAVNGRSTKSFREKGEWFLLDEPVRKDIVDIFATVAHNNGSFIRSWRLAE